MSRVLLSALLLPLAGCSDIRKPDLVTQCMFQLTPEGSYEYRDGNTAAVAAGRSGTQEGADAINACVRGKQAAAGVPQPAPEVPKQGGIPESTVIRRGAGNTTTKTYTYGRPPSKAGAASDESAQVASRPALAPYESAGCPRGVSGMYRGDMLCVD